jgi:hypothetical protein
MPAGAGILQVQRTALTANTASSAYTTPLAGYGTSAQDTGAVPLLTEAKGWKKVTAQLIGGGSGYSFSIYYTADPVAYKVWVYACNPNPSNIFAAQGITLTSLPASSWSLMPGPSEQSGDGSTSNPLTGGSATFLADQAWLGLRVVLTGMAGASGSVSLVLTATP